MNRLALFATGIALSLSAGVSAALAQNFSVATSSPGSIYHSMGSAIAKVAADKAGVNLTVQPFASPTVYLPAVNTGDAAFGIMNVWEAAQAVMGQEHFEGKPQKDVKVVSILFPLRTAIFVRKDSDIKTLADLKGKRVTSGFTSQKTIPPLLDATLAPAGISIKDVEEVKVPNVVAGADAFIQGKADAFFFALGAGKVSEADAAVGGIRALPTPNTPENLAAIQKHWPIGYLGEVKPGPATTGVLEPLYTLHYDAVLVGSAKVPDEVVAKLVKALAENKAGLVEGFKPFGLFDPKRMAVKVPGMEYHAGAQKAFQEMGAWPPK